MKTREKVAKVVVWGLGVLALLAPPVTAVILFWGTGSILYGGMVVLPTVIFFGMVAVMIRKQLGK